MRINDGASRALLQHGLSIAPGTVVNNGLHFEKSNHINAGTTLNGCRFGAYSYVVAGVLNSTSLGRYCSVAHGVELGFHSHPTTWVSSHPFPFMAYLPKNLQWPVPCDFDYMSKPITIGNDVWIGAHVRIMGGVKIGDGAIVATGSLVTSDVEPYAIVGGVPAKKIRMRFPDEIISKLIDVQWWNYDWPVIISQNPAQISWDSPSDAADQMTDLILAGNLDGHLLKGGFHYLHQAEDGSATLTFAT